MLQGRCLRLENRVWQDHHVGDVNQTLLGNQFPGAKVLFVPNTIVAKEEQQAYELFAKDSGCRKLMVETYGFPSYLFSDSWAKSNGFAGSRTIMSSTGDVQGHISWFRILIKKIIDPVSVARSHRWFEMTFFVHQLHAGDATVICCSHPDTFLRDVQNELNRAPATTDYDWRYLQATLLRHVIQNLDDAVWDYSKAVRHIEKSRPKLQNSLHSFFDFPRLHDLLRHTVHCTELLDVTTQTLREWIQRYHAEQEAVLNKAHPNIQLIVVPYHDELLDSFQLVRNLTKRSSSNEARLRNEINLAFNVVSQQDNKAVRIISFVTLAFLPATFVSTLFSMSFFNYQHDGSGWAVADDIWIYFVIAVPMTAFSIIAWVWGPVWAQKASAKGYMNWRVP